MTYNFKLFDNTDLTSVEALESNGVGNVSVPRQIVDIIFNNTTFSPARDSFCVADDVTSRFSAGTQFFIPEGPYSGDYVVSPGGSIYDPSTRRTVISIVGSITTSPLQIVGVSSGINGVWKVAGAMNGTSVYYPTAPFHVTGNGVGDGNYVVSSVESSGSYALVGVNVSANQWSIAGDHTNFFESGTTFKVSGATTGAGEYTTVTATLNGASTDIVVAEAIPSDATTSGNATPWPPITRITTNGSIPVGTPVAGTASIPPSSHFTFAAPSAMLTSVGAGTYSIVWRVTGDVTSILVPGSLFLVRNNDVFKYQFMTVTSTSYAAGITDVVASFKTETPPASSPDGTGYITYPLPPLPYGYAQYTVAPVSSPLMLVGRGSPSFNDAITWGQALQENDIHITENFRTTNGLPPPAPLVGQLWYDEMNTALMLRVDNTTDLWQNVIATDLPVHGDVNMNGHTICNLGVSGASGAEFPLTSFGDTCAINASFADVRYVSSTNPGGDAMAGPLNMSNNKVTNVADPTAPLDAVNLQYADSTYVNAAGDTMTGMLNMGNNRVISLGSPTAGTDAVNKAYVDSLTSGVVWIQGVLDPNLFDDTIGGPDVGSSADVSDPFTAYNRAFIVKPTSYTITGTATGPNRWIISGNHAASFAAGQTLVVHGNGSSDGTYTIVAAADVAATTEIEVAVFIGTPTTSGNVLHARGAWNGLDGHVVTYDPVASAWVNVLTTSLNTPRPVQAGDRFGIFMLPDNDDPLSTLPSGSFTGHAGEIYTIQSVSVPDYTVTWAAAYTPLEPDAVSVLGTHSPHFGHSYTFRGTWGTGGFNVGYKWIQFVGPAMIVDGSGLRYTGNILNVVTGNGLTFSGDQLITDDAYLRTVYLKLDGTGSPMSGNLNVNSNRVTNLAAPVGLGDAVNLQFANSTYVNAAGDTMTGTLILSGDPTANLHAATKQYVDAGDNLKLDVAGGTMTGALVLAADPAVALGAATKQYVDNIVSAGTVVEPIGHVVFGDGTGVTTSPAFVWDNTNNVLELGSTTTQGTLSGSTNTVADGVGLTVKGSDAVGVDNAGGAIEIRGGSSTGTHPGGLVDIFGGDGINGGQVNITGGTPTTGTGGSVVIIATDATGAGSYGGSITLFAGAGPDNTHGGSIRLMSNTFGAVAAVAVDVDEHQNVQLGKSAPTTTDTDGFVYLPVTTGTPTGVPTAKVGFAPMVVDAGTNKLWIYVNGQWRSTSLV